MIAIPHKIQAFISRAPAWLSLATLLACASFIVWANGLAYYQGYGLSQFVWIIHYLNGVIPPDPTLYMDRIYAFFSKIPFMLFARELVNFLHLEPHQVDHVFYFAFTLLAFLGVYGLLRTLGVPALANFALTTWFTCFNPLRHFTYGYQYEVGRGSVSLGLMAFALMTFLFYLLYTRRKYAHAFILLILYSFHPLNTFLYMGIVISFIAITSAVEGKRAFVAALKDNAPSLGLLVILLFITGTEHGTLYKEDNPIKMFSLISLVNASGSRGGFFFSWLNPVKLTAFLAFTPSFFLLIHLARMKRIIDGRLYSLCLGAALYTLTLCAVNFLAYQFKIYFLLPLDLSRIFAAQIPLAFICLALASFKRDQEGSRDIALISLLLMACLPQTPFLLPLMVLFLISGRSEHLTRYGLVLLACLVPMILLEFNGTFTVTKLNLSQQKMKYGLFISTLILMAVHHWKPRGIRAEAVALGIAVLLTLHGYRHESLASLKGGIANDENYVSLHSYLKSHSADDEIVLIEDTVFSYAAIRPHFVDYNLLAYGIYAGHLTHLEEEAGLIWDIHFDPQFVARTFDLTLSNTRDINQHMNRTLLEYTAERIMKIRERHPRFNYIVLEKEDRFIHGDLPVKEVFANDRFRLYKITQAH